MGKHLTAWPVRAIALLVFISSATECPAQAGKPAYCDVEPQRDTLLVRPADGEPPITDINWFARPVPNPGNHWIIGYAMHDQNYLYDLTTGKRVRIPDKSDAVATPDGKYMTVPSYYTPDGFVRFYDTSELLAHLERGMDASAVEPVFIHEHEGLREVFYQSLGHVDGRTNHDQQIDVYRMIFSGTLNETGFRMVDYTFRTLDGKLGVSASNPIPLCPEISNDLMTPFISKDGEYVAAYTSPIAEERYTAGASLKLYRIVDVDYDRGRASCEEVADLGFAAGKADFSYDGNSLTFHISNVSYLAVFIDSGKVYGQTDEPQVLSTDVMVAHLMRGEDGRINGVSGLRRLTTAGAIGSGSYFPAFFPDGKLFYINHASPGTADERRFEIRVADPAAGRFDQNLFVDSDAVAGAREIGKLWTASCRVSEEYEIADHELPWFVYSMTSTQCRDLVTNSPALAESERARLEKTCDTILH
jgi:hypothetical protein